MRRVQRRMQVTRVTKHDDYVRLLETDREQAVLLFRDLLISVTSFFRDADTFSLLEKDIVPRLFAGKDATSEVRIWVPGCATGEEAYSLAILLREHMDKIATSPKVQIFASDIDEIAIGTARLDGFRRPCWRASHRNGDPGSFPRGRTDTWSGRKFGNSARFPPTA